MKIHGQSRACNSMAEYLCVHNNAFAFVGFVCARQIMEVRCISRNMVIVGPNCIQRFKYSFVYCIHVLHVFAMTVTCSGIGLCIILFNMMTFVCSSVMCIIQSIHNRYNVCFIYTRLYCVYIFIKFCAFVYICLYLCLL